MQKFPLNLVTFREFNLILYTQYWYSITDIMLIKEMVAEQLEKLKTEKEERARAGAATPPSPAPSNDSADNRHILQPVDNPESPDSGSQVEFVK